jgi:hypothetical protein
MPAMKIRGRLVQVLGSDHGKQGCVSRASERGRVVENLNTSRHTKVFDLRRQLHGRHADARRRIDISAPMVVEGDGGLLVQPPTRVG